MWGVFTGYVTKICAQLVVKYPITTNYMGQCTARLHSSSVPKSKYSQNVCKGIQICSRDGKWTKFLKTSALQWHCLFTCTCIHTFGENMDIWCWQAVLCLAWYVQNTVKNSPLNSRISREFCTAIDFLNLLAGIVVLFIHVCVCRVLAPPRLNKLPYMGTIKQGWPFFVQDSLFSAVQQ